MGGPCAADARRRMMLQTTPVLRLRGVSKSFGRVRVLDSVDFELLPGEVHALLGGNGAGKSTLMKILEGVHRPDSGTIELDGSAIEPASPQDARELGIAMIFQEFSLVPTLSVAANIFLGAEPREHGLLDERSMRERAREHLMELGIDIDPRTPVARLSTAHWQLIEIAKALSRDARILIMDEPTASLATSEAERLFELIGELRARGISIIYISHRLEEIERVADRVTVLRDGRKVLTGDATEFTMDAIIEHIAGGAVSGALGAEQSIKAAPGRRALLEVEGVTAGDRVQGVSFEVHEAEIVGIVGLMGSGRSELARALFGIDRITGGTVRLHGRELRIRRPADAIAAGIALVPEDRRIQGLVLAHGVQSNLLLPLLPQLTSRGFINDRRGREVYERYADRLAIKASSPRAAAKRLSGGNQQKVVLGKWLAREPQLLILDEPTAGVDVSTRSEIVGMVRELAAEGKGVILISSELTEVLALCHRVIVLRDGRVDAELDRDEIVSEPQLHQLVQVG
jgi:ribose transport system ATP-binding protein